MDIMYTFLVDFARPQRTNELLVMQNDALTRVARFVLMNNGKALDISDVDAVTINAVLPDESRITAEASLVTDDDDEPLNEIIFAIPASMTSAIGKTVVNISLYSNPENGDPKLLNSFEFYINTRNELNKDDGEEGDDYAGIRDLINRSIEAVALVEQLIARSTLPNPYPLRIILEGTTYNYDGSHMVTVDFGDVISKITDLLERVTALEVAFPDGCRIIARAITAGRGTYETPINGVPTSEKASPTTMANNIKTLATDNYNQGVTDTKDIDPTWSTAFTNLTAGDASNLQTKCTKEGWTDLNEIVASTAAGTTTKINTTGDNQTHDFDIVPGVYNKAKVNQKPAYDAGVLYGKQHWGENCTWTKIYSQYMYEIRSDFTWTYTATAAHVSEYDGICVFYSDAPNPTQHLDTVTFSGQHKNIFDDLAYVGNLAMDYISKSQLYSGYTVKLTCQLLEEVGYQCGLIIYGIKG